MRMKSQASIDASLHILELEHAQDENQIRSAYRRQVKRWHPDQFAHHPEIRIQAEERLKRINHAYSVLKKHIPKKHSQQSKDADLRQRPGKRGAPPSSGSWNPFKWKQWFMRGMPKYSEEKDTAQKSHDTKSRKMNGRRRKKPDFESILDKAARSPHKTISNNGSDARMPWRSNPGHGRKKRMRIEGFSTPRPVTPVRPISKIQGIEGSD